MRNPVFKHARSEEVRSGRIRSLLDKVAGDALTPTGTPIGRALHDLFLIEVRLAAWPMNTLPRLGSIVLDWLFRSAPRANAHENIVITGMDRAGENAMHVCGEVR